jgi:hypothetical protein
LPDEGVENEKPVGGQLSGTINPSKTLFSIYLGQQCTNTPNILITISGHISKALAAQFVNTITIQQMAAKRLNIRKGYPL